MSELKNLTAALYSDAVKQCPCCKGSGLIGDPNAKMVKIVVMRSIGLSIRQIMKEVGLRSPSTVQYYIGRWNKLMGEKAYDRTRSNKRRS